MIIYIIYNIYTISTQVISGAGVEALSANCHMECYAMYVVLCCMWYITWILNPSKFIVPN